MSLLLLAKEQDACILICGCKDDAFSERCMLAQLLDVNRQGLTLRLPLDKKPLLPESGDVFLSFTVEDGETASHEVKARAHLLAIRQYDKTLLMCLALPHEFFPRQVRRHERLPAHKLRLLSCGMTPLNYFPRNASQLRHAVAACHGEDNFIETHDVSVSGIGFLLDREQTQRIRGVELFFVSAVAPSFGAYAACHLMASKVAISYCEEQRKSRLHLHFTAELSLLSEVSWVYLGKGHGSKQLAVLLATLRSVRSDD